MRRRRWPGVVRVANARQTLPQRHGRIVVVTRFSTTEGNLVTNYPKSKQGAIRRAFTVLAMIAFALTLGLAATANAGTGDQTSGRDKAVQQFVAQAKAAGLTSAQASALQAKADRYLAKNGGTQIAANRIQQRDGHSELLLAVPGERFARDLSKTTAISPQQNCPYTYLCISRAQNYGGDVVSAYYCNRDVFVPFVGYGSYKNNQTPGTVAQFKNSTHGHYAWSRAAYAGVTSIYVSPIYYVDAC
jgi:hypothetical protein